MKWPLAPSMQAIALRNIGTGIKLVEIDVIVRINTFIYIPFVRARIISSRG